MLFLMTAAFPGEDAARGRLPDPARNVPGREELRDLLLPETAQGAAGPDRGREPKLVVLVTAPDSEIRMSDGESAGEYRRCFICGVF